MSVSGNADKTGRLVPPIPRRISDAQKRRCSGIHVGNIVTDRDLQCYGITAAVIEDPTMVIKFGHLYFIPHFRHQKYTVFSHPILDGTTNPFVYHDLLSFIIIVHYV